MGPDRATRERERLVDELEAKGRIRSRRVADAMRAVPRHAFVPESVRDRAYDDAPLDIGRDQVVTAPHLVADVTELLELEPGHTILEIGTGSGYHAAVLAEVAGGENVYTVERFPDLARRARRTLDAGGYGDVSVIVADGSRGLPKGAPYDRISVTCAAPDVPSPLLDQLRDGGRMVVPLGPRRNTQQLTLVEKRDGRIERTPHGPVRYVPLVGAHGFDA